MDLERVVLDALLLADLVEPVEQRLKVLVRAATVHPAIAAYGRPAQRGVGVPADQDRDGLGRRRCLGDRLDVIELAVELELLARRQAAEDVDAFVEALAPAGPTGRPSRA